MAERVILFNFVMIENIIPERGRKLGVAIVDKQQTAAIENIIPERGRKL